MARYSICAHCNEEITGNATVSGRDNRTPICQTCNELEEVYDFLTCHIRKPTEAIRQAVAGMLSYYQ